MMNLNLTLVIQGINFLISYLVLKKLILEPAFEIIKSKADFVNKVNSNLEDINFSINSINLQKKNAKKIIHQYFNQNIPNSENNKNKKTLNFEFKTQKINHNDLLEIKDQIKNKFIRTVLNDRSNF